MGESIVLLCGYWCTYLYIGNIKIWGDKISFLKNEKGVFKNITATTGIQSQRGLWNTITAGDFDNDGDIDYIVGNTGKNSFYRASEKYPISIYAKDFDNNGSYDAFPTLFLPTSHTDEGLKEYPAQTRDDIVKQMIGMRSKFQNYKTFAKATKEVVLLKSGKPLTLCFRH